MLIYLSNEHVNPLLDYLKRGMTNDRPTPTKAEADAIGVLFQNVEIEKQGVPYRLWQREHAAPESPSLEVSQ